MKKTIHQQMRRRKRRSPRHESRVCVCEIRTAIVSTVQCTKATLTIFWMSLSVSGSMDAVASSMMRTLELRRRARAKQNSWNRITNQTQHNPSTTRQPLSIPCRIQSFAHEKQLHEFKQHMKTLRHLKIVKTCSQKHSSHDKESATGDKLV